MHMALETRLSAFGHPLSDFLFLSLLFVSLTGVTEAVEKWTVSLSKSFLPRNPAGQVWPDLAANDNLTMLLCEFTWNLKEYKAMCGHSIKLCESDKELWCDGGRGGARMAVFPLTAGMAQKASILQGRTSGKPGDRTGESNAPHTTFHGRDRNLGSQIRCPVLRSYLSPVGSTWGISTSSGGCFFNMNNRCTVRSRPHSRRYKMALTSVARSKMCAGVRVSFHYLSPAFLVALTD